MIELGRRYFPHGINHHWVDAITGTGEITVVFDSYLEATFRGFGNSLSEEAVAMPQERFPDVEERWCNSHFLETGFTASYWMQQTDLLVLRVAD